MWKDFLKARDDGLVRNVGVSNLCVHLICPNID
jgi:diketogulonate reductase-like aldo/keto reductase